MKVVITRNASDNLFPIYEYHLQYSEEYADEFQYDIDRFMLETLSANPQIGHVYDAVKGIRSLIYQRRYNIYYTVDGRTIYVVYIYDGRMDIDNIISSQT